MNIAVVGTVMHDRITTHDGREFSSFGGILYNLLALSAVVDPADRILPVGYISAPHLEEVGARYFASRPFIDRSAFGLSPATDTNILRYVSPSSRRERMSVENGLIAPAMLDRVAECDAVQINLISGHELDIDGFRRIRVRCKGVVYLDVHNLGKLRKDGVPVPGHRFDGWPEFFACVDIVQANEWEAERLIGYHPENEEQYREAVLRLAEPKNLRAATLTLGGQGCALAWRDGTGALQYRRIPAAEQFHPVDTTGCGDCFSAGFLVEYLRTGDPLRASYLGATLSGMNCEQIGLDGLAELKDVRRTMAEVYPGLG